MKRLRERLDALYAIGGGLGANRPGFSSAEDEAQALAGSWMAEAGLEVSTDLARNLYGRLRGRRPELPEVWSGSHLDSVPRGGRFDGPLGVLAALEAVEWIGRQERTLCVVAFRDEEGSRFGRGCFGSRALCGLLEPGELATTDADGVAIGDVVGDDLPASGWLATPPAAYVEAHIEQGPVLDGLDVPLGVVTSIAGLARLAVTFSGRSRHAGTTSMAARDDALCKAAEFVLRVRDAAIELGGTEPDGAGGAVATVGRLTVEPNAANVVPDRVSLFVDARAPTEKTLELLLSEIDLAATGAEVELLRRTSPISMAESVRAALRDSIVELGLPAPELQSGATHDAAMLRVAGVPSGMLFVRSLNGVSHSPDEHSNDADIAFCVDALARALKRLAGYAA